LGSIFYHLDTVYSVWPSVFQCTVCGCKCFTKMVTAYKAYDSSQQQQAYFSIQKLKSTSNQNLFGNVRKAVLC